MQEAAVAQAHRCQQRTTTTQFFYRVDGGALCKRRLTPQIKRELQRRAAIEPVIGHLKAEHRMGHNYLARRAGDAVNAVLAGRRL